MRCDMKKNTELSDIEIERAKKLKEAREKQGLSLQQVSDKLKKYSTSVSAATLQRYESGEISRIPIKRITALSKIYNTTPEYLLGFKDKDSSISRDNLTKHNIAFFKDKDISDEDKKKMIDLMQEFYYKQKYENEDK